MTEKNYKPLDSKYIREFIKQRRLEGVSDQAIYDSLVQEGYMQKSIAHMLCKIAKPENIKKYGIGNKIIIGLLIISILTELIVLGSLGLGPQDREVLSTLMSGLFVKTIGYSIMAYHLWNYSSGVYGFIFFILFLNIGQAQGNSGILLIVILFGIIVYQVRKKLFPNLGLKGIKPDESGRYIFPG